MTESRTKTRRGIYRNEEFRRFFRERVGQSSMLRRDEEGGRAMCIGLTYGRPAQSVVHV